MSVPTNLYGQVQGIVTSLYSQVQGIVQVQLENLREPTDETNGFILKLVSVSDDAEKGKTTDIPAPAEVISIILSYLDCKSLVSSRLVCRSWKKLIDTAAFKLKTKRLHSKSLENVSSSRTGKLPWYVLYTICKDDPFNKNLILNGCGQDGMKHWEVILNGGHRWKIEKIPAGSHPLPEHVPDFESYQSCFVTSYSEAQKQQTISLLKHGFTSKILDEMQPDIEVSDWFAGRFDCGCRYQLVVSLLDKNKKPIKNLDVFHQEETINQWEGNAWKKVSHVFKNYGRGVRYVVFIHSGRDTQFWAGHYGSKMSGARVVLKIPELDDRPK